MVLINADSQDAATAMQAADSACYIAKNSGGNRIYVNHNGSVELDRLRQDQRWALRIKRALQENRFRFDYQPIVSLGEGGACIELLLRLIDETGQTVRPRVFWAVAERHDLTTRLDRWVVSNALAWLSDRQQTANPPGLCFINLAASSIKDSEFLGFVIEQFEYYGVAPERVCFEIKEEATQRNLSRSVLFIKALKHFGCRFALDNFGHSQFSLANLKKLPVDFLKIDRVFIRHVVGDPVNRVMVKSLNDIGQAMGKITIAEFVEDQQTLAKLREIGVGYVQGYFTGRPRSLRRTPRD